MTPQSPIDADAYDDAEATEILQGAVSRLHPTRRANAERQRLEAAEALLAQFSELLTPAGFRQNREQWVLSQVGGVWLRAEEDGEIRVAPVLRPDSRPGEWQTVPLELNPATGRLEGREDEKLYEPVPGERRRKRSPLAVLAEGFVRALEQSSASR